MSGGLFKNREALILASSSPRRRELLQSMGIELEVFPSHVEELESPGESPSRLVRRWAGEKACEVSASHSTSWVLAADTAVVLGDKVLGKPTDDREAAAMIRALSGCAHRVISAFCLKHGARGVEHLELVSTRVRFKSLSDDEVRAYVATGESLDKAGAYGIQGLGAFMVHSIDGSYTNVVGLPLCETLECLVKHGVIELCH